MAKIIPFNGILYNTKKCDPSMVTTPPYDVISSEEQEKFYENHPNNIIRLILGKEHDSDTETNNRYTRAASYFEEWQKNDSLIKDEKPALYFTAMDFFVDNKKYTRFGIIGLIGLESFDSGVVKPHEKTFSNVKSERLKLVTECHANFSPIFSIYSDPNNEIINTCLSDIEIDNPELSFTDDKNQNHRVYRIINKDVQQRIGDLMKDKVIFIADGHHRY